MISSGEAFSGAKNCVFTGMVAPRVAKVGSVFLRASIWENCQQEAHETAVIEADLHVKTSMKDIHLQTLLEDEVCKMRMVRFAWDAFCFAGLQWAVGRLLARQRAGKHRRCCYSSPALWDCSWRLLNTL